MKAICKYTGLELVSSSGFARWCVVSEHPIFAVPLDELIQMASIEWSPEMFVLDKKLLLLAIAKQCDLLTWQFNTAIIPANPSISTIESSIQDLLQIAGWIDFQRYSNKFSSYPALHITEETASMLAFPDMLRTVINTRDYTDKEERKDHRLKCLANNAANLSAKCRIGANREASLLRTTAEWALLVTDDALNRERVSPEIKEDWKTMLMTSASNIKAKGFSIADVDELRDFMVDNLPHGSVIAHDVITHLQRLVAINDYTDIDGGAILGARILQNGALVACETEPQKTQYANIVDYARAKAGWLLARAQREETAKQLAALAKQQQQQQQQQGRTSDDTDAI